MRLVSFIKNCFLIACLCVSLPVLSAVHQQKQTTSKKPAKKVVENKKEDKQKPPALPKQCKGMIKGKKCSYTSIDGSGYCPKHQMLKNK